MSLESLEKTVFPFAYRQVPKYLVGSASAMGLPFS
jgi:hypothetical protein